MWKFILSLRWSNHRIAAAFLLAPIIPCAVATAFWIASQTVKVFGWVSYNDLLIISVFLCWVATGLFALPVFVNLRRRNRVNLKTSIVTGISIGFALGLIANFPIGPYWADPHRETYYIKQVLLSVLFGASVGFLFWLIGVWRNPVFQPMRDQHLEDVFN